MRYPGFLRTFGSRLGAGLADELLDRWFPPPPSFLQRFAEAFIDQAPVIVSMVQYYIHTKDAPKHGSTENYVPAPGVPLTPDAHAKEWEPLGEFTCPKCGGHTWSSFGSVGTSPVLERHCTNGLQTAYGPDMNPNTVKEPCMFRWFSTDDHLHFAKPSVEEAKTAAEKVVCAPPREWRDAAEKARSVDFPGCVPIEEHGDKTLHETEGANLPHALMYQGTPRVRINHKDVKNVRVKPISYGSRRDEGVERTLGADANIEDVMYLDNGGGVEVTAIGNDGQVLGRTRFYLPVNGPVRDGADRLRVKSAAERLGLVPGPDADRRYRSPLQIAIGERTQPGENVDETAARLITEADAFIKKQSDKIADLMLDNVFPAGRGEIGFVLTHDVAKKIGVRYEEGAEPIRATLILDGWRWAIRLGLGRVGGQLVPVEWSLVEAILKNPAAPDQTAMAQNAAGGMA